MSLSTISYLVFLMLCLALHWALPGRFRNFFLLLSSVAFFAYAMPLQAVIMMVFCLVIYALGFAVAGKSEKKSPIPLTLGVGLAVGFLFVYKYLGPVTTALGGTAFSLVVPMGISYVAFQCIAYLVQIYKGNLQPEKSPVNFMVYALFFPKLTAGPIEDPATFLSQLKRKRRFTYTNAQKAVVKITVGFVKKVAVADLLAPGVAAVFDSGTDMSGWAVVLASLMYAVQILCDFSGYTDIARGSAMLFGMELTENFDSPYLAVSVRDFWRRWHISLSNWLKTYIFIPLGGSRVSTLRRYANILIVFLVSGIWHGSSWSFVVWGALHGVYQIAEILLDPAGKKLRSRLGLQDNSAVCVWAARIRTFLLVTLAWVFFRAATVGTAFSLLGSLFTGWGSLKDALTLCGLDLTKVLLTVFALVCANVLQRKALTVSGGRYTKEFSSARLVFACAVAAWAVFLVYMVSAAAGGGSSFIYFDF